jgi:hypothetical protein
MQRTETFMTRCAAPFCYGVTNCYQYLGALHPPIPKKSRGDSNVLAFLAKPI